VCVTWTGAGVKVVFEKELGVVDFFLPNRSCVVYISECDIIAGNSYKRKLVRFRNVSIALTVIIQLLLLNDQLLPVS